MNFDNYGGQVGELISHNGYAYCMNNPLNMKDEQGNSTTVAIGGLLLGMLILYVGSQTTTMPETSSGIHIDLPTFSSSKEDVAKKAMTKAKTKKKSEAIPKREDMKTDYKEAYLYDGNVYVGADLTYEQAREHVRIGGNIMTSNQYTAKKVAMNFLGVHMDKPHGGDGYFYHYHINGNPHIWFMGEPFLLK